MKQKNLKVILELRDDLEEKEKKFLEILEIMYKKNSKF